MRFLAYTTLALLFSVLVYNTLQAQELPCDNINDPLVTVGTPSLFGDEDFCCGQNIEHTVCYDLESYFSPPSLIPHCGGLRLLGFEYPGGAYSGNQLVENPSDLADALNSILVGAGLSDLATFEANTSNLLICADGLSSNEFSYITIKCFDDIIQILPTIETINTCPVSMEVLENAYEGINESGSYDDILLFDINNTAANGGAVIPGTTVSGDPISTSGMLNGSSWDVPPGSTVNPNALPSMNDVGHLLNAAFGSGMMLSPCSMDSVNVNCMVHDLLQFPFGSLDDSELDLLNDQLAEYEIEMTDITDGIQSWLNTLEANDATPASYINSIFGWNLPDETCIENFGGEAGSNRHSQGNQDAGSPRGPQGDDIRTEGDEDYFSQDIPGIGAGGISPPTPSALAMMQAIAGGVNLYNGAQSSTIPLHTLQAYDINVPVSISSSNNGLQVDALPSSAGQHWSINAGGQITRMVKGLPDEFNGTIESVGVGQQVLYTPRIEIPSTVGIRLEPPVCPPGLATPAQLVRTGIELPLPNLGSVGNLGPITFRATWSGFQPDKVRFVINIPITVIPVVNIKVSLQLGMDIGYGKSTFLMPIEYQERAVGYAHIDNAGAMGELGLPTLNENLLTSPGLSDENKADVLRAIHPGRKRDDDAVVSDIAGTWAAIRNTWDALGDGAITHETQRVDLQPDEYQFTAGAYSGKFFIKPGGQVFLTPYQPGIQITPTFENGEFKSFEVETPDGFVYTFGRYEDNTYIDYTQDVTYMLPNFYSYPEKNTSRELFGQAQIDVSIMERFPFFNGNIIQTPYGNTYDRNYRISQGPMYASAWHLVNIRSIKTQQHVNFEYELRQGLSYFSSKSYTHTFPDFNVALQGSGNIPVATTDYEGQHNPLHTTSTRWENGRAEFTYNAVQTTQNRWDLTRIYSIAPNRGEEIIFVYGEQGEPSPKQEIPGDVVCSKIKVIRNGSLYRGWKLGYAYPNVFETPPALICETTPNSSGGILPVSVEEETTFNLGAIYKPNHADYHRYFFLSFAICKLSFPVRLSFPIAFNPSTIPHRSAVSELGSLMEVRARAYNHFNEFDWLDFSSDQLLEIFRSEGKRTFLMEIKEIDQSGGLHPFVGVEYNNRDLLPKRFSTNQDQYGYACDNSVNGSPFPSITYSSISSSSVNSSTAGIQVHYGFSNKNATSPNRIYEGRAIPSLAHASRGAIVKLNIASGASFTYHYGLNALPGTGVPGAGLRVIKKVENPGDTPLKTTTYDYLEPAVNSLPRHVSQNRKDTYYRVALNDHLETRVMVTSYPQNIMLPNGANLSGYAQVTESWSGIGRVVHHFTTPSNFSTHITIPSSTYDDYETIEECLSHYRNSIFNDGDVSDETSCTITEASSPSVFMPSVLRQFDFLFGVEWKTETFNKNPQQVLLQENDYRLVPQPKRLTGTEKIRLFNSSMYQYTHYGTFWQLLARRAISQYAPFALKETGVSEFISDLVGLIFSNTSLSGRYIWRRFETVHYDYPALQIVLDESKTTETYSGGGTTTQTVYLNYLPIEDRELLLNKQTVVYSDDNEVETRYHYAFQAGTSGASPLLGLHDNAALTYLNTHNYQQPVAVETYVNDVRTQANLTALTLLGGNKIAPKSNYGLQNGNLALLGKFGQYNADAKPERYLLAKFGATVSSPTSDFFDPIELTWYPYLSIPLKTRKYLEFQTTNGFSAFYEYASNTDVNGVTTGYEYDNRGRLATVSNLNGRQVTTYTYSIGPGANSILTETAYSTGEEMDLLQAIDGFGKEKTLTRLNDGATLNTKTYDDFWRVLAEDNIGTGKVNYVYEASPLSKLLKTTDEENNVFSYVYKGQSAPGTSPFKTNIVTDPNGHPNESYYNSLELLTGTKNVPENSIVIYTYDQLLRPATIINPIGELFTYSYNNMGLLWQTTVPGRGPQSVWYDHKFRPVVSSDGNNQYILTEYDNFDRPEKTYLYESGFSISGQGISNDDQSSYYTADKLLSDVEYVADSKTWVNHTENRLLEDVTPPMPVMVISDNTLDDIGRVTESVTQYPDNRAVTTTLSHSSVGYLLGSDREIVYNASVTENVSDIFEYDNVLRPHTHKVFYGAGQWVFANRMEYNAEDLLITKWVGGMPMEDDQFLQEVNYAYDRIGRLVRINDSGTFFCNIEEEVCAFSLELKFPLLWENCTAISGIKINGQVYPLGSAINLLTQQSQIAPTIEAALAAYGLGGEASTHFDEDSEGQTLTIGVTNSRATELSLILGACGQEVAFTPNCCTIPPVNPVPPIPRSEDDPEVCTADLYHQLMRYNGLDIQQITIGSGCGFMMRNLYEYDGLHRLTTTNNVFFGPTPYPDAFSNSYTYDEAGNIQQLMRRGIIDMGPGNVPESDIIDQLNYTYAGSGGVSSVLVKVEDVAENPLAQPLGVNAPLSTYGHDGNGNMTIGGPVTAQYNILNLPTKLTTTAGTRYFGYVYGAGKYSARLESTPPNPDLDEVRHYLGGIEFVDGKPESYNFGDGRIVYEESGPRPQFRLHDHLGNTVVFFEDKDQDGCITTEADATTPEDLEILQRPWYYPFGMEMEGIGSLDTEPGQWYRYNGKEKDVLSEWTDFGARWGILEIGRWNGVDPMAHERSWLSPYNFVQNNPINRVDPTGALDEWVEQNGQMMYDNRVTNQADATALYGEGATYRPNGYTYTASNGASIELGDYGFFKQNGQIKSSPDLAASSLANTNPSLAISNAQSQIAGVRGNYSASAGIVGFISVDAAIPEPTDAAWPKWAAYAVAGGVAAYYVAKMEGEIEGIMRRAGGPQGTQYSLQATSSRSYTCYTCGSGTMNLSIGDVWKYGETTNPSGRYTPGQLSNWGVRQVNEFFGNQVQIKVMEKTKIYGYFLQNGHLPPGNKIFR